MSRRDLLFPELASDSDEDFAKAKSGLSDKDFAKAKPGLLDKDFAKAKSEIPSILPLEDSSKPPGESVNYLFDKDINIKEKEPEGVLF